MTRAAGAPAAPLRVVLFGASGMIGQGVLRECLADDGVSNVLAVGRSSSGVHHRKVHEVVRPELFDLSPIAPELTGHDACFFCIGVSSAGMGETEYTRLTYDLALGVARQLAELNPGMTFVYVSAAGADATGQGRVMWARVRGRLEQAVLALPFRASYVVRPAVVIPMDGIQSRTRMYRVVYAALRPLLPLVKRAAPRLVTTTRQMGRAMLRLAREGHARRILESADVAAM